MTESLSPVRQVLMRLLRGAPDRLITVSDAARTLDLSARDAALRLGALARAGWLARVRRGLYYAVPLEAESPAHAVPDDPWLLADALFAPCYIGGWSAAAHWELTEQLFKSTFVATAATVRRSEQSFAGLDFHLARINRERIPGTTRVWRGRRRVAISDRERTIVDALVTPAWVGGVRHLSEILAEYVRTTRDDYARLLAVLDRSGSGAANKRFAYLAERLFPNAPAAHHAAERALRHRSTGIVKLDPAVRSRGTIHRRWGLAVNVAIAPVA